ncbi:hypothetical protein [Actinokineospora bangkokensis]|uniref:Uncharacterized protein n=1 Tax=Actinokineospora bangkokensis TaxID=1193682 RepID=A0A1Q9LNA1_9PSEU|nr:hypothetical protein [Actinokineospora bangkokensis]OLR93498.1 hypothetical protein BJP25_14425 [Actinokineospora bangkokensis]
MSEPPYQPNRPRPRAPRDPGYGREQPYGGPDHGQGYQQDPYQQGYAPDPYRRDYPQDPYPQDPYPQDPYRQQGHAPARPPQRPRQEGYRPEPRRPEPRPEPPREQYREPERHSSGGGFRLPGLGVLLAILGTAVQVISATLLPWISLTGGDTQSLIDLWKTVSSGGLDDFGDWYVVLFSYPLVVLSVLLAFSAVLESVAMKVVWAGLAILGLGYVALRFGLGPFTGLFGVPQEGFSTPQLVVAVVAVALLVGVAFAAKTAISVFRRIAGVVLLALSGVHVSAVADLTGGFDLASVDFGAFGPTLGYLLIGVAALIGPRRLF